MNKSIIEIHNEINKRLINERDKYQQYYDSKIEEYKKLKKINKRETKKIDEKINELDNNLKFRIDRVKEYNNDVKDIIRQYLKKINTLEIGAKFNDEILDIINMYMIKASKYKLMNYSRKRYNVCVECGSELEAHDNFYICKCGFSMERMDEDYNIDKNVAIRRKKFILSLYYIQGKENDIPPIEVFDKIKKYINDNDIVIKKKRDVKAILKTLKLTEHKIHANYIFSYLTGKKLLDIPDDVQDRIIMKYDLFMQEYDRMEKMRKNAIKNQHLLYYLLKTENIKVNEDDFDLIKTRDSEIECNNIINTIFNKLKAESKMNWNMY